ncbi:pseudouridine-5'-phosphate glycosidase [Deinococcus metallilatus]|uniref:Pseudouridine-5'-phosphate glycosidase n=1 Tax=Deinococcus metallilatus TaxID=1211322 RepID=A0AAJ5F132_9DEIO|nr:pseudouridine-5'-phosphate glycosidase [Deinococcus metallilatus]MBB5297025.1 pseudouridine-5'-phosphate glycosidase [Deinococcus metallilatus]QBY07845.1 pseudouridine-5'-phosphate glycosidase [Deinococcus metallilatus]RXJ13194.1 pseudouridine-5'-phosphate glycosidase [Deinococcus metallilatus]TLK23033.1 pseudouridine-5'-phosphate glycosidase [Deinococcus metallilatus]GMA15991.1 pseudouridine-5'-phosphate glycosidase [Deinococcus metallilatus]
MTTPIPPQVAALMDLHPEVAAALAASGPVVALESTIISHGMPYPQNVEMARGVEAVVRENGATPATIAVLGGRLKVGLTPDELELLAADRSVQKISTRDLPFTVALGGHGATTVASTMRIASLAGIRVFATGGTGGVHRGASESMDISADLTELARTDVCVVSAGVKSILDIGLTLEVLETHGVPAITLGSPEFPAFYSRQSGFASPLTVQSEAEAARVLHAKWTLGLTGGVLLANPIPQEAEIPATEITPHIERALSDMAALGLTGKETTPYLLGRIVEITEGRSLAANIALVRHNAAVAARVASEYAALQRQTP